MFRRAVSRLAALLLLLALPACAPPPDRLTLWTMQLKPDYTVFMTDLVASYQRQHPALPVEWMDIPWSEMEQKALIAMASGQPPDVLNLNPMTAIVNPSGTNGFDFSFVNKFP